MTPILSNNYYVNFQEEAYLQLNKYIAKAVPSKIFILVDENTNENLPDVVIFNENKSQSIITDLDGIVDLSLFSSDENIFFQLLGYSTLEILKIEVLNGTTIYLQSESQNVEEERPDHLGHQPRQSAGGNCGDRRSSVFCRHPGSPRIQEPAHQRPPPLPRLHRRGDCAVRGG